MGAAALSREPRPDASSASLRMHIHRMVSSLPCQNLIFRFIHSDARCPEHRAPLCHPPRAFLGLPKKNTFSESRHARSMYYACGPWGTLSHAASGRFFRHSVSPFFVSFEFFLLAAPCSPVRLLFSPASAPSICILSATRISHSFEAFRTNSRHLFLVHQSPIRVTSDQSRVPRLTAVPYRRCSAPEAHVGACSPRKDCSVRT